MIHIDIPGYKTLRIENLIMDYNGTIALDGNLLDGIDKRLERLSNVMNLFILTADTFGLVEKSCSGLPVQIKKLHSGHEAEQKKAVLEKMGHDITAAIGNGANDVKMLERACLGIVVLGQEGLCTKALNAADICVPDACAGLNLFLAKNMITTKAIMIMFFQKVCQLVRTIASPKQPQSSMGFEMASTSVRGVKTDINSITPHIPNLILYPINMDTPKINSADARRIAKGNPTGLRKPRLKAVK